MDEAMRNGFTDELQKIADARGALKDFATGAKAGVRGVIHAAKAAVKPGAPAIQRGIVAGGAALPAAAGLALGAGGTLAATHGKKEEKK